MCGYRKTKTMYSLIDSSHYSDGSQTGRLLEKIEGFYSSSNGNGGKNRECCIGENLFNTFEIVYNNGHEQFGRWKEYTECLDIGSPNLAGSGPAVYYLFDNENELMDLADQKNNGNDEIKKYIARTVP